MRHPRAEIWPTRNGLLALLLLVGLFLAGGPACPAAPRDGKTPAAAALPADLDLVPRDAAGFVHIRVADLWKSDDAKDIRHLVDRAGPEAWKAFEKKCPLNPATLDRITVILLTPQTLGDPFPTVDPEAMSALFVVTTTKPFDRPALIQALGPREKVYRQNLYYFNEDLWSSLVVVDERTFLIGSEDAVVRYFDMSRTRSRTGPLQAALAEAAHKHQVVIGLNPTLLGKDKGAEFVPPPIKKLLTAHCGVITLDLDKGINVNVRLDFHNEDQAREGETALRGTLELGRQGLTQPIAELEKVLRDPDKAAATDLPENFGALLALGFLRELDTLLKEAPIERQESAVKLALTYKRLESSRMILVVAGIITLGRSASMAFAGGPAFGLAPPGGKDPLEEHLRNLSLALDRYHEKHGSYPPAVVRDKEGRPVLSWRVALLPYLGEEGLYNEFKLDEPWDSLHNKRLLKKLPKALKSPNRYGWGASRWKTTAQVFTGAKTVFEGKQGVRKADVDKQTILLAHVADDAAVYWTKPADLTYAADKPLPRLFGKYGQDFRVLMIDGSYRTISKTMDEKTLRALIERSGDKPAK